MILKTILGQWCKKVVVRHSFHFKRITFLKSDIDFSLIYEDRNEISKNIQKRLYFLRKLIPFLGEINIYDIFGKDVLQSCLNKYEGMRDPWLSSNISLREERKEEQKIVFLYKLVLPNLEVFQKDLKSKFNKLSYCMEIMETTKKLERKDLETSSCWGGYLKNNIFPEKYHFAIDYLMNYIDENTQEKDVFLEEVLCPTWKKNHQNEASQIKKDIILENCLWELWGIYSQLPLLGKKDHEVKTHLLFILERLESLNQDYSEEINYLLDNI